MKKFLQILAFVPFIVAPIACGTATDDVVDVVGTDGGSAAEPETPHNIPEIKKAVDFDDLVATQKVDCVVWSDCIASAKPELQAAPVVQELNEDSE